MAWRQLLVLALCVVGSNAEGLLACGSAFLGPVFRELVDAHTSEQECSGFQYDATDSAIALQRVARNESYFALSTVPLADPRLRHVPVALFPIVLVFSLPGIHAIVLGMKELTLIFSRDIAWWNDHRIRALNPDLTLPEMPIKVLVHKDHNDITWMLTKVLTDAGWENNPGCRAASPVPCGPTTDLASISGIGSTYIRCGTPQHVTRISGSIGYAGLHQSLATGATVVLIKNSAGNPTLPSTDFMERAAATLNFGHSFVASGLPLGGYPLVGVVYTVLRARFEPALQHAEIEPEYLGITKDYKVGSQQNGTLYGNNWGHDADERIHLHSPMTCGGSNQVLTFLYWTVESEAATAILMKHGITGMPRATKNANLRLLLGVQCDGAVWRPSVDARVAVDSRHHEVIVNGLAHDYLLSFLSVSETTPVHVDVTMDMDGGDDSGPGPDVIVAFDHTPPPDPAVFTSVPFAVEAWVLVFNPNLPSLQVTLELDVDAVILLLQGHIRRWSDERLRGGTLPLPDLEVTIVNGAFMQSTLTALNITTNATVVCGSPHNTVPKELQIADYVRTRPGSLAAVPLATAMQWGLSQVLVTCEHGPTIRPSPAHTLQSAQSMIDPDTGDMQVRNRRIGHYPFVTVHRMYLRRHMTSKDATLRTIEFAQWMLGLQKGRRWGEDFTSKTGLRSHSVTEAWSFPEVRGFIMETVHSLTVDGHTLAPPTVQAELGDRTWVWTVVGACAFAFLFALSVAIKHRSDTAHIRRLLDSNAIAEKTAVAIADMRLEQMDYLRNIPKPNRIQRAFIRIVDSLIEYRSFLPQAVREQDAAESGDDDDDDSSLNSGRVSPKEFAGPSVDMREQDLNKSMKQADLLINVANDDTACGPQCCVWTGMNEGAKRKHSTVMWTNLNGFHSMVSEHGVDIRHVTQVHSMYVSTVATAGHKSVLLSMNGDRCVILFDKLKSRLGQRLACVKAALSTSAALRDAGLEASIGAAGGVGLVGNFGSASFRQPSVIGNHMNRAYALCRAARLYGVDIVVAQDLVEDCSFFVLCRALALWSGAKVGGTLALFHVVRELSAETEEWMYLVASQEKSNPYKERNARLMEFVRNGIQASDAELPAGCAGSHSPLDKSETANCSFDFNPVVDAAVSIDSAF